MILNLETSTDTCSVCVSRGAAVLNLQASEKAYQHAEVLTVLIKKCMDGAGLKMQELDAVAVSSGPGSYTSLRVGTSVAKGICYAFGLPLIAVDTLLALALAAQKETGRTQALFCPMIDARRMEVYTAVVGQQGDYVVNPRAMVVNSSSFSDLFSGGETVVFTGNGAPKCSEVITADGAHFHPLTCSADYLPVLSSNAFKGGKFEDLAYYAPMYLKPPNITKPKNMSVLEKFKS